MREESTRQAAQEYLAEKLSEEEQKLEDELNLALANARALQVWAGVKDSINRQCREWNAITNEETLTCKETMLGDLRIWCAAKSKQMMVLFNSRSLLITVINSGRLEHEKDVLLQIEGYRTGPNREDRDTRLMRSGEQVNMDMLILGELRVLTGMKRQRNP